MIALKNLRRQRQKERWKTWLHYYLRALQSGLFIFLLLIVIGGVQGYGYLLTNTPVYFMKSMGIVLFLFAFIRAPFVTYLFPADLIFLTPLENRIQTFFKQSWLNFSVVSALKLCIIFSFSIPIFVKIDEPWGLFSFGLIAIAIGNGLGIWQEMHLSYHNVRAQAFWTRIGAMVISLFVLFFTPYVWIFWIPWTFYIWFMKKADRLNIGWQALIEQEKNYVRRSLRKFSYFVDLPQQGEVIYETPREAASFYDKTRAYQYFYQCVLFRGESVRAVIRFNLIGIFIGFFIQSHIVFLIIYLLMLLASKIQLSQIGMEYKHQIWFKLYPISEKEHIHQRKNFIQKVLLWIWILLTIVLGVSLFLF